MKKLFIKTSENGGHVFFVKELSVNATLTFCKVDPSVELSFLLNLLKKGIICSFDPAETYIRVAFRTKYVEEIL